MAFASYNKVKQTEPDISFRFKRKTAQKNAIE